MTQHDQNARRPEPCSHGVMNTDDLPAVCFMCSHVIAGQPHCCFTSVTHQCTGQDGGIVLFSKPCKCSCRAQRTTDSVPNTPRQPVLSDQSRQMGQVTD